MRRIERGKCGERGRNRTFNLLIKSQLLCQLSYAPTVGIWLVGRTEIIASDRLFSPSDALIHLEDLISIILRYTHDSTGFLGGINDSPTDSIGFYQSQCAFCVAATFLRSSSLTFVHDAQFFMSRIFFGHNFF
jgi:hypothetical protein